MLVSGSSGQIQTLSNVAPLLQPPFRESLAKTLFRVKASLCVQPARNIMLIEPLNSREPSRERVPH
jgi:hypothetical protein